MEPDSGRFCVLPSALKRVREHTVALLDETGMMDLLPGTDDRKQFCGNLND